MPEEMITFKEDPEKTKSEGKNHRAIKFASRSLDSFKRAVERKAGNTKKRTRLETNYNEMYEKVQKMIKKDDKELEEEINYGLDYLKKIGVKLIAMDFDRRVKLESDSKKVKLKGSTLSRIYQRAKKFIDNKVLREANKTVARDNFDDAFYRLRFGNEQVKNSETDRLGNYSNFGSNIEQQRESIPISVEPSKKEEYNVTNTNLDEGLELKSEKAVEDVPVVEDVKPVEVNPNVNSILSGFAPKAPVIEEPVVKEPEKNNNNESILTRYNADSKPVEVNPNVNSILSGFVPKAPVIEEPVVKEPEKNNNNESILTRYNADSKPQETQEKEKLLEEFLNGISSGNKNKEQHIEPQINEKKEPDLKDLVSDAISNTNLSQDVVDTTAVTIDDVPSNDQISSQINKLNEVRERSTPINFIDSNGRHRIGEVKVAAKEKPVVTPTIKLKPVKIDETIEKTASHVTDDNLDNKSLAQLRQEKEELTKMNDAYVAAIRRKEEALAREKQEREQKRIELEREKQELLEKLKGINAELSEPKRR